MEIKTIRKYSVIEADIGVDGIDAYRLSELLDIAVSVNPIRLRYRELKYKKGRYADELKEFMEKNGVAEIVFNNIVT